MTQHESHVPTYVWTFVALLALLGATSLAAHLHLGALGDVISLVIAVSKAGLVAAFFMHLKWSSGLTRLFAASGVFWLLILIALSLNDYLTRPAP